VPVRVAVALSALLLTGACIKKDSLFTPQNVTTITLGPALATSAYRPNGLPAIWTGYCPVATPSNVTIVVDDAVQVVNRTDQPVSVTLGAGNPVEGIPPGGTGSQYLLNVPANQASLVQPLSVLGCIDTASGQPLANITVRNK
jgi:hypothetical protein